jgi:DNA-binding NtrC family response regulator
MRQAGFVTANPHLNDLFAQAGEIAARDCPVLVVGESGTGKVMFARGIHGLSARRGGPFHTQYCGESPTRTDAEVARSLPRAEGGTLAVDGIVRAPPTAQDALYAAIQTGRLSGTASPRSEQCDVRILALTNPDATPDMATAVVEGTFRRDLYEAFADATFTIPPLREHPEGIPMLVEHFLRRLSAGWQRAAPSVAPETMDLLVAYEWPRNARDLMFALEYAAPRCDGPTLLPEHLPDAITR